ncbi:MAG: acyl-CoA dehydrogenase [Mangrovicoccus sp.]|nr:acyl-CoA dehydrogenase [Mangrovicoccus sp.]
MPYTAPVGEFKFLLAHVAGFARVAATERFAEATPDVTDAILTEAGKLCDGVMAPLARAADLHPAHLENGVVRTAPGFAEAYRAIAEGGWVGVAADPEHGGMGLPLTLATAINDMMSGACLALQLCPLLSQGQIEALERHAGDAMKALYLPKLISGEWTGTMNLTEPQAGSDVGAVASRAEDNGDGSFAITGQKIFISWGDHDVAANVCHLVLARLPGAAPGTRGLSLFLVPKLIPDAEARPGRRNSLSVVSLEHKLGLHGSPTAVMQYDRATGWIVGAPGGGMAAMFTMMNNARLGVGAQGIGVAEAAFQHALAYAQERRQGRTPLGQGTIIDHADVRRMLAAMKADILAARAIALDCAVALDMAAATGDADWSARAAFLTPIAKAFGTDTGIAVSGDCIQIFGGMGVIEETGAAQFWRDVRVTAIYEGTNGIQAMDLVGRKLSDGGAAAFALLDEIDASVAAAAGAFPDEAAALAAAATALRETTGWMLAQDEATARHGGAVAFLRAFARVLGGHYHLRAAMAEGAGGARARLAAFYVGRLLPEHAGLLAQARAGAADIYALTPEDLATA